MPTISTSRREFLKFAGKTGAFLMLGVNQAGSLFAAPLRDLAGETAGEVELNSFILITPDNRITLFNPRPEMGQGTWQSMPALIAEELEVDFSQIDVRITGGDKRHGPQGVGGSGSVRGSWLPLRKVGAAAKEMLVKTAAKRWNVPESECYAQSARVMHRPSGKKFTYGELVAEAALLEVPQEPVLKDPKDFKILGKAIRRSDIPSKVNGSAVFGIDVKVPGMLYASVEHCPVIHGTVKSFNAEEVLKIPGVKHVIKTERKMPHKAVDAVAVIATTYWAAVKGRRALQVEWDNGTYESMSTAAYFEEARRKAASQDGVDYPDTVGNVKTAFASAPKVLEAVYETPFASHAQIEPVNATAWVQGDKVELWVATQGADFTISEVANYLSIPEGNVKVNLSFMGGSFGRKSYLDFVLESVHLSKAVQAPIKLIWSREDDMANGPYRPGMINALKGALDREGKLIAWEHKLAGEAIAHQVFKEDVAGKPGPWMEESIDQATSPYVIPNRRLAFVHQKTDIPIVWWRAVYSSTNPFGQESFMDEMAHAAGKDPLDFRLAMLKDQPRWRALLEKLAEKSNYRAGRKAGKSIGIAVASSFESIVAYAVTVTKKGAGVRINKVVGVIDCGLYINPDTVRAQTEGNIAMALSTAIKPGITYVDGQAQETNFHQYPLLSMREMPPVELHIMENREKPGGVGEPGLPPFTPALFNAVFLATGKRIRRLPVDLATLA